MVPDIVGCPIISVFCPTGATVAGCPTLICCSTPDPQAGPPGWYEAHWQYPYSEQTGASGGQPSLEPAQQAPWPTPQVLNEAPLASFAIV